MRRTRYSCVGAAPVLTRCAHAAASADGKCSAGPGVAALPAKAALREWSTADVASFLKELAGDGPRQTCPSTCPVLKLFGPAADAFASKNVDGRVLSSLLLEHAARIQGTTNASSLPAGVPAPGAPLHNQFMTRLRDAVRLSLKLEPPNRTDWLTSA